MDNLSADLLLAILNDCASAGTEPIYPKIYAEQKGVERATLDRHLDHLRMKGLLSLTEWVQGKGQGYALTAAGRKIVSDRQNAGTGAMLLADAKTAYEPAPHHVSAPPSIAADVQEDLSGHRQETTWSRGERVRDALINVPTPYATWTIVMLNGLVFLVGAMFAMQRQIPIADYLAGTFQGEVGRKLDNLYHDMGSVFWGSVLLEDQWWRLLTFNFLHRGIMHIGMNMYFLYAVGPRLEGMWGLGRFVFLYLLSGVGSGVAVVLFLGGAVGASGALCGLLGSMVFWIWLNRAHLGQNVTEQVLRRVFINIGLIVLISILPFVSATGHLGGGLTGLILAYPMTYHRFGTPTQRWLGLVGMIAVVFAVFLTLLVAEHRGEQHWEEILKQRGLAQTGMKKQWPEL